MQKAARKVNGNSSLAASSYASVYVAYYVVHLVVVETLYPPVAVDSYIATKLARPALHISIQTNTL